MSEEIETTYFPQAAQMYSAAGWATGIPLPAREKFPPPAGFTGNAPRLPREQDYINWAKLYPNGNIALVVPDGWLGFDVDTYGEKQGWHQWFEFWDSLGFDASEMDETWISSARNPVQSGIRWFRVPKELDWPSQLSSNVEIIRPGHRYAVVWPSVHPDGMRYEWYAPGNLSEPSERIPGPHEPMQLPAKAVNKLKLGAKRPQQSYSMLGWDETEQWLEDRPNESLCSSMAKEVIDAKEAINTRDAVHDAMVRKVQSIVHLSAEGCAGIIDALNQVYAHFSNVSEERGDRGDYHGEWMRAVIGAVSKASVTSESCWCDREGIKTTKAEEPEPEEDVTTEKVGRHEFQASNGRRAILTPLSEIKMKRARWMWKKRIAMGSLAIVAGNPSMGKSTLVYWIVAQVTNGNLYGEFFGQPKDVIVCATEDDFEITIKPRLVAAGADVSRVFRIDIKNHNDVVEGLNLVDDRELMRAAAEQYDIALLVLDPLMSRLGGKLDSHKDAEVRRALEPLTELARECEFAVIGLMHFNKSGRTNPVDALMGSVAFGAVARSVHICAADAEDPAKRLFGTEKNNLGPKSGPFPSDLDTWAYYIESVTMATEDDDEQPLETSRIKWDGNSESTITDSLIAQNDKSKSSGKETKQDAAINWLISLFDSRGALSKGEVLEIAERDKLSNHSVSTLRRAIKEKFFATRQTTDDEGRRVAVWGLAEQLEED